jgi:hypothetical protein
MGKVRLDSGWAGLWPRAQAGQGFMRIFGLIGILLALSGCANERSIAFIYYPNHPPSDFPRPYEFAAEAQKECAKYGLVAVHDWESVTDFQRVRSFWRCVPP